MGEYYQQAQRDIAQYGKSAWSNSRQERDRLEPKNGLDENLRDKEHYLYAAQEQDGGLAGAVKMGALTAGYSTVKALANGAGHVSQALGGRNFSPWRGSPATMQELGAGFRGTYDGYMNQR